MCATHLNVMGNNHVKTYHCRIYTLVGDIHVVRTRTRDCTDRRMIGRTDRNEHTYSPQTGIMIIIIEQEHLDQITAFFLTSSSRVDFRILISWTSPFPILGLLRRFSNSYFNCGRTSF